jgi:hypothetical protein
VRRAASADTADVDIAGADGVGDVDSVVVDVAQDANPDRSLLRLVRYSSGCQS